MMKIEKNTNIYLPETRNVQLQNNYYIDKKEEVSK